MLNSLKKSMWVKKVMNIMLKTKKTPTSLRACIKNLSTSLSLNLEAPVIEKPSSESKVETMDEANESAKAELRQLIGELAKSG